MPADTSLEQISVEAKPSYRWVWFQRERFQETEPDFQVCWGDEDCYKIKSYPRYKEDCCFWTIFLLFLQSNMEEAMCCLWELTIICRCGLSYFSVNKMSSFGGQTTGQIRALLLVRDVPYIDLNGGPGVPFLTQKWGGPLGPSSPRHPEKQSATAWSSPPPTRTAASKIESRVRPRKN